MAAEKTVIFELAYNPIQIDPTQINPTYQRGLVIARNVEAFKAKFPLAQIQNSLGLTPLYEPEDMDRYCEIQEINDQDIRERKMAEFTGQVKAKYELEYATIIIVHLGTHYTMEQIREDKPNVVNADF